MQFSQLNNISISEAVGIVPQRSIYIDFLGFWAVFTFLVRRELDNLKPITGIAPNQINFQETEVDISEEITAVAPHFELSIYHRLVHKFRKKIASAAPPALPNKNFFNEKSNYHPFIRQSGPDSADRRRRISAIIHRIRGKSKDRW